MHVCTKEYPPHIPLYSFLTIFLTKAKKAYRGYVSSYCSIDRSATDTAINQLETSKKQFNQLLDTILIVETRFLPHVRRYGLEKKYNTFLYTFVEFVVGIYDEQEHLIVKVAA